MKLRDMELGQLNILKRAVEEEISRKVAKFDEEEEERRTKHDKENRL